MNTETASDLIQWPTAKYWDCQWNVYVGCHKCSPACENCWAEAWAKRFHQSFEPHRTAKEHPPKKGVCFCGNLSDLFGEWVCESEILGITADAARRMESTAQYIWLTKRVERMKRALDYWSGALQRAPVWFSNCWWGFTAENQKWFDVRSKCANAFPDWAKVWVSAEPLLGTLDLHMPDHLVGGGTRIEWVVVGCESGPNRRPCRIEWVESVVEQCIAAGVPVFVKQISINGKCVTDIGKFPKHLRIRQTPWAVRKG